MAGWEDRLRGDPLPWLLDEGTPAVRQLALRFLLDRPADDAEDGEIRFYKSSVPGPGFQCGANDGAPCAWGPTKALLALARIPPELRSPTVQRAIDAGVEFLLGRDPAVADYPMGYGLARPSGSWFKLGFPSGYVTDILQVLEAVCQAGHGADRRLDRAVQWLLSQQDGEGRWANHHAYEGKMAAPMIDEPGRPSRWVTLRACTVLKAVGQAGGPGR